MEAGSQLGIVLVLLLICLFWLCSVHSTGVCCYWWVLVCNWIAFTTSLSTIISNRRANICCYPIKNPTLTAAIDWFYLQFDDMLFCISARRAHASCIDWQALFLSLHVLHIMRACTTAQRFLHIITIITIDRQLFFKWLEIERVWVIR